MNEKPFELLATDTITVAGVILVRLKATKDIPFHNVKAGDLGGYVQSLANVDAGAWVGGQANVKGNARIEDRARVEGYAKVQDDAVVKGTAVVRGRAKIFDTAVISDTAVIGGNAQFLNSSSASGNARLGGDMKFEGDTSIDRENGAIYIFINTDQRLTVTKDWLFVGCVKIPRSKIQEHDNIDVVTALGLNPKLWPGLRRIILGAFDVVDAA